MRVVDNFNSQENARQSSSTNEQKNTTEDQVQITNNQSLDRLYPLQHKKWELMKPIQITNNTNTKYNLYLCFVYLVDYYVA